MPFAPEELTLDTVKGFVDRLVRSQKNSPPLTTWPPKRAAAQETVAHMLGFPNWHALHVSLSEKNRAMGRGSIKAGPPVLGFGNYSILDVSSAKVRNAIRAPYVWEDPNDVVSLVGADLDRYMVINHLSETQNHRLLWLRGIMAKDFAVPTPGYGFMPANQYQLYAIVDHVFQAWSAQRLLRLFESLLDGEAAADPCRPNARRLLSALLPAMVHLRDKHQKTFSCFSLKNAISLPGLSELASNPYLPDEIKKSIVDYDELLFQKDVECNGDLLAQAKERHRSVEMLLLRQFRPDLSASGHLVMAPNQIVSINERDERFPLVCVEDFLTLLVAYVQVWVEENPGGVVVFDGILPDSPILGMLEWAKNEWAGGNSSTRLLLAAPTPEGAPGCDVKLTVASRS